MAVITENNQTFILAQALFYWKLLNPHNYEVRHNYHPHCTNYKTELEEN